MDGASAAALSAQAGEQRLSMAERAYRHIKARILENDFPPGYQALEQELAIALGMSRTPVREAFVRLEKEGLVEVVSRRGMRVRGLSPADMRELYDILCCLETKAVELLAKMPDRTASLAKLEREVSLMEQALAADDLTGWAAADARFHDLLLDLCGNRRLAALGRSHLEQARRVRMFTLRLRRKPMRSTEDHRQLLGCIAAGDADTARELNWRHREAAAEELLEILDRFELRHL